MKDPTHLELPLKQGWDAFMASMNANVEVMRSPISFQTKELRTWLSELLESAQVLVDAGVSAQGAVTFLGFVAGGHLEAAKEHHRRLLAAPKREGT